jgi:choline dehydrogenase-like flavoprotein
LPNEIETDVCVIGSGAGGAVAAKELAEGGLDVVILEKGSRFTKYDFTQKESEAFPQLYEDQGMRATADQSIIVLHAKGVGGTTLVNHNISFRAPDFVLRDWSRWGVDHISPQLMAPYYESVEKEISVTEIKPEEVNQNDRIFHQGAERLGLTPKRFLHNRRDCIGCGFCYCGCSYDRKENMALTYLPKAEDKRARILANTEAEGIERKGKQVTSIVASQRNGSQGETQKGIRIRAKCFVLAGGGISTPALLLRNGFGRLNRNIGRHLTLHPILANIGVMSEPVYFYEGIPQCEYVDQLSHVDGGGFLLEGINAHPILTSLSLPSFGRTHREAMREFNRFTLHYVMVKDRPQGEIRVSNGGRISIHYRLHQRDVQSLREGMKLSARVFFAAGAKKVHMNHVDLPPLESEEEIDQIDRIKIEANRILLYSAHQLSSCRMGPHPKTSVTDSFGKIHGLENLYISDASLFPTSLGHNPQLTIMALAARNAEFVLGRWGALKKEALKVS